MAKQGGTYPFPNPPKPTFPVEIVPPSKGFGGGSHDLGGGKGYANFSGQFLRLMTEAGERLGKAAAAEIEKVQLRIEGGGSGGTGFSNRPDGTPRSRAVPGDGFAMLQFARAAGIPGAGMLGMAGPVALGVLAAKLVNFPSSVDSQLNEQRHLGRVSPSIASAFAQSDARDLMRDLRIGEAVAPGVRDLTKARGDFKDTVSGPLGVAWDNWWNKAYTNFLNDMQKILAPGVKKALGELSTDAVNPWIDRMDRLAGIQQIKADDAARRQQMKHENDFRAEASGGGGGAVGAAIGMGFGLAGAVNGGDWNNGMLNRGFP